MSDSITGSQNAQNSNVTKEKEDMNSSRAEEDPAVGSPNHLFEAASGTAAASSPPSSPLSSPPPQSPSSTNGPAWDFETFLEEQRRKEVQHDDRKEKVFQKVLSALGDNGDVSDAAELPPNIVQAWIARKEKLSAEAENAQKRKQKLEVRRAINSHVYTAIHPSPWAFR